MHKRSPRLGFAVKLEDCQASGAGRVPSQLRLTGRLQLLARMRRLCAGILPLPSPNTHGMPAALAALSLPKEAGLPLPSPPPPG